MSNSTNMEYLSWLYLPYSGADKAVLSYSTPTDWKGVGLTPGEAPHHFLLSRHCLWTFQSNRFPLYKQHRLFPNFSPSCVFSQLNSLPLLEAARRGFILGKCRIIKMAGASRELQTFYQRTSCTCVFTERTQFFPVYYEKLNFACAGYFTMSFRKAKSHFK